MNFYKEFLELKTAFVKMAPVPGTEDEYLMRASRLDKLSCKAEVLTEDNDDMENSEEMEKILMEAKKLVR